MYVFFFLVSNRREFHVYITVHQNTTFAMHVDITIESSIHFGFWLGFFYSKF